MRNMMGMDLTPVLVYRFSRSVLKSATPYDDVTLIWNTS